MTIQKLVNSVTRTLSSNNIKHEVSGDEQTFTISPTCSIYTNNCTIEIYKDEIKVNEKLVDDLDEMIDIVIKVEG
ncbi:hypothetical protein [Paenibacillus donghaensis]|uniref:DUF1797 domain-containing protein n=1 Tax=Paenibacillus donghaensis TaxID=414771 RepID=A0A2Z2KQU6_9BACL|nr:hypothetical protein [Paenibacillus donghaensis]ASA22731.1 hypothetical protein B9T62_19180 [Paenibacillus donghaensis]